jgi:DNA-binding MarR family transcriptional regulator
MNEKDWNPQAMPAMQIYRVSRFLGRINEQRLRTMGFSVAHLPVFAALKDGSARSQKELTKIAQIEQPTMAQMLARMERDGLVQRTPDPNDKRSSLISLTPKAFDLLPEGRAILAQVNEEALAGFSEKEKTALVGFLRRVMMNVEPMAEG